MTENLKCCFCGSELQHWGEDFLYCENLGCPMSPQIELPISIWQALIDGKKAQRQLRTTKDRCVKKIKAKQLEIHNCLYGIHVRDYKIEMLQEKLSQVRDVLDYAIGVLDNLTDIGGVDMQIIKIKEMAGIK